MKTEFAAIALPALIGPATCLAVPEKSTFRRSPAMVSATRIGNGSKE